MSRKRKRGEAELSDEHEGQLCEKCRSIFATLENMRRMASNDGLKHHNAIELAGHAKGGCMLCILLCEKLRPQFLKEGPQPKYVLLSALSKNGTAIRSATESRYPRAILDMRFLKAKWTFDSYNSMTKESYCFDIIPLHGEFIDVRSLIWTCAVMLIRNSDSLKKWGFQFVPLECHTSSDIVIREIKRRLKVCQGRHRCSNKAIPYLPTRVIDIGSVASGLAPYLYVPPKGTRGSYLALSYTWGGEQEVRTTSETLSAYTRKLPVYNLPKTIQDALVITQKLGIRYLWVDAFCIIQDSPQDKASEIDTMGTIYQNAVITIAATCARSVNSGFLQWFSRQHSPSLPFKLPNGVLANVAFADLGSHWIRGPLDDRAWAFQEFHLSPRLLLYGYSGDIRWYCQSEKLVPLLWQQGPSFDDSLSSRPGLYNLNPSNLLVNGQLKFWTNFVEDFSKRVLTYAEDRLPALVGIVRYLKGSLQDDYLAGTWRNHLIEHLIWSPNPRFGNDRCYEPCLTAPSWSWASTNRPVEFYSCKPEVPNEVTSCVIEPIDNEAPFEQVKEGKLTLRALVIKPSKKNLSLFMWDQDNGDVVLRTDKPDNYEIDSREFALVRLAVSDKMTTPTGDKIHFFRGIVVTHQQDGRYKRIGSFAYEHKGKLLRNSEGFYETGKLNSEAWAVKEIAII
jgi:hypothetical protein